MKRMFWYSLFAAGAGVVLAFWWHISGSHTPAAADSLLIALGNVTGLLGTYTILWQVVTLSRLTVLEDALGLEQLHRLHKWNGYAALILILGHAVFLTFGFAAADRTGLISQFLDFNTSWQDVLKATVATILLIGIVGLSISIVRRRLKYETWYFVHLGTYLAILLSFDHQLSVGTDFANQPAFRAVWYALLIAAAGLIMIYRILGPLYLLYKHRFTVAKIIPETPDIISIYITGRRLKEFHHQAGQFVIWRFLSQELWWQAHPFSLSLAPNGRYLRLTVKMLGDFTRQLAALKPGTPVLIDGPHGHFTAGRLHSAPLLLIAGGSGITPIRALLEQLTPTSRNLILLYAARTPDALALRSELDRLGAPSNVAIHYLVAHAPTPGLIHGLLDQSTLHRLVPDAAQREVFLCGPPAMMAAVTRSLIQLGAPRHLIHTERFAY